MTTLSKTTLGFFVLSTMVWETHAMAAQYACDNIHAAQIALDEGLVDCDTTVMVSPQGILSGAQANFVDVSWQGDCVGKTANACAAYHYDHPERTVQAGSGSGDMELIFPETTERCSDGTKPAYYFSPGSGSGSHKWIIYLNGSSGKCAAHLDRATGDVWPIGPSCFDNHQTGNADSSFLLKEAKDEDGILSPLMTKVFLGVYSPLNPHFYNWNRVHIPSCSNDQYQGQRVHDDVIVKLVMKPAPGGFPYVDFDSYTANVYSRGHLIVRDVLSDLAQHADLTAADQVVLHGTSGGAAGLIMTLDDLAGYVRTLLSSCDAQIVGLIDSRGAEPGLDNSEAQFDNVLCSSIFEADCGGMGFDNPPVGADLAGFGFDSSAYRPNSANHLTWGATYEKFLGWYSALDEECQVVHGENAPECMDTNHVLFNHLGTPVFIAASISDSNQWNNQIEMLAANQVDTTWQTLDCGANPGQQYIDHSRSQLVSYVRNRDNPAGGADGESHDSAQIGVWAPQIWEHVLAHDSCKFSDLTVGGFTLSDAFWMWLGGNTVRLIDRYQNKTTGAECVAPQPDCTP